LTEGRGEGERFETVGERLGRRLHQAGVRWVFGHPGGETVDLLEGFRRAGLEFVLARHETTAAFMAEAVGASTGVPGVCLSTLAPGATNMLTGVSQAYLDRSPLLAFSAQLSSNRYPLCTHQKLDLIRLYGGVTKWATFITPTNAEAVLAKALRVTTSDRRGPVFLEVPPDVAAAPAPRPELERYGTVVVDDCRSPGREAMEKVGELLARAERPLLLAGTEAAEDKATDALVALADHLSIPVIVSPKAKGVFPEDHPSFVGTIEMLGTGHLFELIDSCDLIIACGLDPVELDADWSAPATIVNIAPRPNVDLYFPSKIDVVGSVTEALTVLRGLLKQRSFWAASKIEDVKRRFHELLHPVLPGLLPQDVVETLRKLTPRDLILACDVGTNKAVTGQLWTSYRPGSFYMSNGLSSMGYGLPAAIGLKLSHPDRPVAAIVGDGGFGMYIGEIETAVRIGLDLTIVILADDRLDMIARRQERSGYRLNGTETGALDYPSLAEGLGARGLEVSEPSRLEPVLTEALQAPGVTLVACRVNSEAYKL